MVITLACHASNRSSILRKVAITGCHYEWVNKLIASDQPRNRYHGFSTSTTTGTKPAIKVSMFEKQDGGSVVICGISGKRYIRTRSKVHFMNYLG